MRPLTRKQAVLEGSTTYFTEKECKYGHLAQRQVTTGSCCECRKLKQKRWRVVGRTTSFKVKELPPLLFLKERLSYDHSSGDLIWKVRKRFDGESTRGFSIYCSKRAGKLAGSIHHANKYRDVRFNDHGLHKAHRIVWFMHYEVPPEGALDHIDGDTSNNAISNLREATAQDNARNTKSGTGTSKYKGVSKDIKGNWCVQWCINGVNFSKRGFTCELIAAKYYDDQVKTLYKGFARLNFP